VAAPAVSSIRIKKINGEVSHPADDLLAAEEPLEIRLGFGSSDERRQKSISVTMRTPGHDFELALGFLFSEGIIKNKEDVSQIRYCTSDTDNGDNIVRVELKEQVIPDLQKLERHFYTSSSCGICGKASIESIRTICPSSSGEKDDLSFNAAFIYQLPALLRKQQNIFDHTGGLHASALFDEDGNLLFVREDAGRHNALDKLIGAALASGMLPLNHHVLLLSGRASFELIQKAAMAGVRVVAAVGAPSSLAVQAAKEFNMTLIGFLRDQRFNIYSGEERIKVAAEENGQLTIT
jgi:FdhD protein